MNYPLYVIPFLPIMDLIYIFSPKKIRELKENNRDVMKWTSGKDKNLHKSSLLKKIFVVGGDYATSLIRAYLYNLVFFPKTLYIRFKRKDYLKETKEKWL